MQREFQLVYSRDVLAAGGGPRIGPRPSLIDEDTRMNEHSREDRPVDANDVPAELPSA